MPRRRGRGCRTGCSGTGARGPTKPQRCSWRPSARAASGAGSPRSAPPPAEAGGGPAAGPVAALTRASVRPAHLLRFWARVPDIQARVGQDANVLFKIGIGEVPFLHQVTFSVWPDAARMDQFARTGPHAAAIAAVRQGGWFSEELYARFRVTGTAGTWGGADPLQRPTEAA